MSSLTQVLSQDCCVYKGKIPNDINLPSWNYQVNLKECLLHAVSPFKHHKFQTTSLRRSAWTGWWSRPVFNWPGTCTAKAKEDQFRKVLVVKERRGWGMACKLRTLTTARLSKDLRVWYREAVERWSFWLQALESHMPTFMGNETSHQCLLLPPPQKQDLCTFFCN